MTAAATELYGRDPQEFTDRRKALATAARDAGDPAAARQIAALRKPTRAAWVVNRLTRVDPDAPGQLAALAEGLRAAGQAKDGSRLRELSARRGVLIDDLTGRALAAAGVADPPAGLREDVAATLTSALADPEVAAQFAAGTLTRAAQWAGFGLGPGADLPDDSVVPGDSAPPAALPPRRRTAPPSRPSPQAAPPSRQAASPARPQAAPPSRRAAQEADRRAAQEADRRAAEEGTARRRKALEDAERAAASAAQAAAAAATAEDRLEATVRDLEQRLTRARADLADARLRARRAEAAERKARQHLDRLPRP